MIHNLVNTNEVDIDFLFSQHKSKYNTSVKLTASDKQDGLRVLCKEPYAQDLYDLYAGSLRNTQISSKDLTEGDLCTVIAKTVDFTEKTIIADEINSKTTIYIPFREFTEEPSLLMHNQDLREFKVLITKAENGNYYGSEKQCASIAYRDNLNEFLKTDKWFYVKVISLVKGGYLALYKGTIRCFLPGSHAAANVIRDFNDYLNTEIPVMIENYDSTNDLYIVSYKKYIKHTLPQKIYDLEFGKEYTGILTNRPYDFGIFVEFQNYYTGLLHKTEFDNYESDVADYKAGDEIKFYIKDIIIKKGEPRIILTNSLDKIDQEKVIWQQLKQDGEGKTLFYTLNKENFTIDLEVWPDSDLITVDVSHLRGKIRIPSTGEVRLVKIDPIRKNIKLDFQLDEA